MIRYNDMSDEQKARCDDAMEKFTSWLNSWHEAQNETWTNDAGETVPVRVTRESYFEYDDPPRLLLDSRGQADTYYRVMIFQLNPYHDEGGPNEMTCYFDHFDHTDGWYDEEIRLRHMDQLFDTMIQPIFNEGKFLATPEKKEVE
jgi:hypothetical protein